LKLEVGSFYEFVIDRSFDFQDADFFEPGSAAYLVRAGTVVRCVEIVKRNGGRGRGRYAALRLQVGLPYDGGTYVSTIYERVSSNNIGQGGYIELEPLVVLARAEETGAL